MESLTSGTLAGTGTFRCEVCGHVEQAARGADGEREIAAEKADEVGHFVRDARGYAA